MAKRRTFVVTLPDKTLAQRTSESYIYTHAICVFRGQGWVDLQVEAARAQSSCDRDSFVYHQRIASGALRYNHTTDADVARSQAIVAKYANAYEYHLARVEEARDRAGKGVGWSAMPWSRSFENAYKAAARAQGHFDEVVVIVAAEKA